MVFSLKYHCLDASFKPYRHFLSLHNLFLRLDSFGGFTNTFLVSLSPCRNALLMSIALMFHFDVAAMVSIILTDDFCIVGESVGKSSSS